MEWLVAVHVISAIVGIGPTYFGHVLFRKRQRMEQLRQSLALFDLLNYFPKIGGSIAVVSGVALVGFSGWEFADLWIWISLVLYVLIQIVAVGILGPVVGQLIHALNGGDEQEAGSAAVTNKAAFLLAKANRLFNIVSFLGLVLIVLMIVKPM
ncbi:DUF2269 family protein [Cohnella faecalis]|uniref:DUF2269 family protein n=1 Tax=Cohnella faecalis TaxID=2315694 RepID=A0A398CW23_9BACL|nr:DUF2269 family protein [Cohnella faecalis]RIE04738.1 DUF2269 family protein [Cohnella faecalis]